jgi:hypothetical protein
MMTVPEGYQISSFKTEDGKDLRLGLVGPRRVAWAGERFWGSLIMPDRRCIQWIGPYPTRSKARTAAIQLAREIEWTLQRGGKPEGVLFVEISDSGHSQRVVLPSRQLRALGVPGAVGLIE